MPQSPETINSTQKARIKNHRCLLCNKTLSKNTTILRCKTCNDALLLSNRERTNKFRELGKCIRCGKDVENTRYTRCAFCRMEQNAYQREYMKTQNITVNANNFYLNLEIESLKTTGNYMGFNLRRIRKLRNITHVNTVKNASFGKTHISNIELGTRKITLAHFVELINIFGISPKMFEIYDDKSYEKLYIKFDSEVIDILSI